MVNLVSNPSFEDGSTGWNAFGSPDLLEFLPGQSHLITGTGSERGIWTEATIDVVPGMVFQIFANVVSGTMRMRLGDERLEDLQGYHLFTYQVQAPDSGRFRVTNWPTSQSAEAYIKWVYIGGVPMALATKITLTVRDGSGHYSYPSIHVPDTATITDITEIGQQFATLMDDVMDGVVLAISSTQRVALPGGLDVVLATSDVEKGGLLLMQTALGTTSRLRIPTLKEAVISSGSDDINLEQTEMAALVTLLEDGFTTSDTGLVQIVEYRGEDITNVLSGAEDFQRTRKSA